MRFLYRAIPVFFWGVVAPVGAQQPPPSYTRDIRPFFAKYCIECHTARKAKGSVNLDTFQAMMRGNKRGRPIVIAGSPDKSSLVLTSEHRSKPVMPPRKAKQPAATETTMLRAWVAAGARDDTDAKQGAAPALRSPPLLTRREEIAPKLIGD